MGELARSPHNVSVFRRVALPFVVVAVFDCVLLVLLLMAGGTFTGMYESGLNILGETTLNKYQQLESTMQSWMELDQLEEQLCASIEQTLSRQQKTTKNMADDTELNSVLVDACKEPLFEYLQIHDQSGVFLILNGMGIPGKPESRAGVYLYDSETSSYVTDHSDISLLRGLPPLSRELGITLHSYWQPGFSFPGGADNPDNDYFFKPLNAYSADTRSNSPAKYYGYWSPAFQLDPNDGEPIIAYSMPLVSKTGEVYGVLGISATMGVLREAMGEGLISLLASDNSYYLGVTRDGGLSYECVTANGNEFLTSFTDKQILRPQTAFEKTKYSFITVEGERTGQKYYGAVYPLKLYSRNTIFEEMQWALIGIQNSDGVLAMEKQFRLSVITVVLLGLGIGICIAFWLARGISKPITRLMKEMKSSNNYENSQIQSTGIIEVDALAQTIIKQKQEAVEEASRVSKIISLSGLPIGTFEKHEDQDEVFCSDDFFRLLNREPPENSHNRLPQKLFRAIMEEELGGQEDEDNDVYLLKDVEPPRYLRVRVLQERKNVLGTLMDVTEEVGNLRRVKHERDFDLLTNLLNRRAFESRAAAMFNASSEELRPISALVMIDLDNLKAVNDTNGHDNGDLYIREFATALESVRTERCLLGRRSGDEFYMLYYGYQDKGELLAIIQQSWKNVGKRTVTFNDGMNYRMHASGGIAWFPEDSVDFKQLLHYADFAMYRAKNSDKGSVGSFNRDDYRKTGYMVNGIQALNRLLDQTLVRYAYQPIVSARDGSVMGYEMLMRPLVGELAGPMVVLNLAREQGMLSMVESLTWRAALADAAAIQREGKLTPECKLFINTIANQVMSEEEENSLFGQYKSIMTRVVMEITESENPSDALIRRKIQLVRSMGGQIAIDDFGAGYNCDISLVAFNVDYVKMDMSFIRNVHIEPDKSGLISNVIKYAHKRQIKVIAEGVECVEEMRALAALEVDYFQGYYLAYPDFVPPLVREEAIRAIKALPHKPHGKRSGAGK